MGEAIDFCGAVEAVVAQIVLPDGGDGPRSDVVTVVIVAAVVVRMRCDLALGPAH